MTHTKTTAFFGLDRTRFSPLAGRRRTNQPTDLLSVSEAIRKHAIRERSIPARTATGDTGVARLAFWDRAHLQPALRNDQDHTNIHIDFFH